MTAPKDDLLDVCRRLADAARDPKASAEARDAVRREASAAASGRSPEVLEVASRVLLRALDTNDPLGAGLIAITLGAFVENGLAPNVVAKPVVATCRRMLVDALPFVVALREAASPDAVAAAEEADEEVLYCGGFALPMTTATDIAHRVGGTRSRSYEALGDACLAVIACLTRDAELRRAARADTKFVEEAAALGDDAGGWLRQLLVGVADEEWVVLHATLRRGWLIRATEINDNWCIGPLLAEAIVSGTGWFARMSLPFERPPAALVDCLRGRGSQRGPHGAGQWEQYTWRAIDSAGRLKEHLLENKIWNEGIPLDIPQLDGTRVVVLGPQKVKRSWAGGRSFGALGSDMRLVRELTRRETEEWLMGCARGAGPSR